MTLANALGVVAWRDQRLANHHQLSEQRVSQPLEELWCWSLDLDAFWDDEHDPRWCLLVAIAQSLGFSAEQLFPCDQWEDKPAESLGIAFGQPVESMVSLPALDDVLAQPQLKKQVWWVLCQHFLAHGNL